MKFAGFKFFELRYFRRVFYLCLFFLSANQVCNAQVDTASINKKRLIFIGSGAGAVYVGSMVGLNYLWFADYPRSSFHFFNDDNEWLQMDKCGHFASSYYISKWGMQSLKWAGLSNNKAAWYGAGYSMLYMTTIEVLDGFSTEWGFSVGDMIANTAGASTMLLQQLFWKQQRITLRFSYHPTEFAELRPDVYGDTPIQNLFKDYNGQTYWLSGNIKSFIHKPSKFPKWLNISFGYGADGMTGGSNNPDSINGQPAQHYDRIRQFYFAPDIDLTRIRTKSKVLNTIFDIFGFVKFPLPTLEYNSNGKFVFHPLYF